MRWGLSLKTSLSGKFLLSYLLIVLVGVATLLAVTFAPGHDAVPGPARADPADPS